MSFQKRLIWNVLPSVHFWPERLSQTFLIISEASDSSVFSNISHFQNKLPLGWGNIKKSESIRDVSFVMSPFFSNTFLKDQGQRFRETCKEHVYRGRLEFQWFLQLPFFCNGMCGTQTTLSQKKTFNEVWFDNEFIIGLPKIYIEQLEQSVLGILDSFVNQMFFVAWPLDFFLMWWWLMTADDFSPPILVGLVWHTHWTQTLQRGSLRSSALIWQSTLLIWTSQNSHLEPFQSTFKTVRATRTLQKYALKKNIFGKKKILISH